MISFSNWRICSWVNQWIAYGHANNKRINWHVTQNKSAISLYANNMYKRNTCSHWNIQPVNPHSSHKQYSLLKTNINAIYRKSDFGCCIISFFFLALIHLQQWPMRQNMFKTKEMFDNYKKGENREYINDGTWTHETAFGLWYSGTDIDAMLMLILTYHICTMSRPSNYHSYRREFLCIFAK